MTHADEPSLLVPELDGIPEDDYVEPEDADVLHLATPEEVGDTAPPVEVHDHAVGRDFDEPTDADHA